MAVIKIELLKIQPSQLYINKSKLESVQIEYKKNEFLEPIPIKKLNDKIIFTDGHTRGYYYFLLGIKEIDVIWEQDELDWGMYQTCIDWCYEEKINSVEDFQSRVIQDEEYKLKWIERCRIMQENLLRKRGKID